MHRETEIQRLLELSWRRPLTPAEAAELRTRLVRQPGADQILALEHGLTRALERLPDAPVPSNFTERVLQEATRPEAVERNRSSLVAWWRRWLPRTAIASLVVLTGLVSWNHTQNSRRLEMVQSVATVAEVSSLPSPEILQDFDAILALSQGPGADEQLLTLLQ